MIDYTDSKQVMEMAKERYTLSKKYYDLRKTYADSKSKFDFLLSANLANLRIKKANLGIDTAKIMLLEESEEARKYYEEMTKAENLYKGLEKVLDALQSSISLIQSLIKNLPKE